MSWRVLLEMTGTDGVTVTHEVSAGARQADDASRSTVGLSLAEGKATLAALQHRLVQMQAAVHCERRRRCPRCGSLRPIKDRRSRRLVTLFGEVCVNALRFAPCRCGVASRRSIQSTCRVHARPVHAGIRTCPGANGRPPALRARRIPDERVPAARAYPSTRDGSPADPQGRGSAGTGLAADRCDRHTGGEDSRRHRQRSTAVT